MAETPRDRRSVQRRLEHAERLLRVAGRVARLGGWVVDLSSRRVEWSDEVCDILEVPHGTTLSFEEAIASTAPEWRARTREVFEACARDGVSFDEEKVNITAGGRRVWIRTIGEAVRDAGGRITQVQGAFQDITDTKDPLRWSEMEFRRIADAVPLGIWSAEPDGTLDYANKALYDYVGTTPEALPPSEWPRTVHPDDRARALAEETAAFRRGEPFAVELRLRRGEEGYFWHLDSGKPLRDAQGRIVKWYGAIVDIHDRKLAEEALRESEERFRQLAENIGEVFWMTVPDKSRMLYVSPAYEAVWGRTCESLYEDPNQWIAAIHEDDRPRVLSKLKQQHTGGYNEEYRIVRPDGEIRWIWDRAYPVHDETGRVYRICGVARDVTSRKRMEEELRESEWRFEAVARATTDVIWDWDLRSGAVWRNEHFETVFGYRRAEIETDRRFWENAIHPDDRQRVLQGLSASLDGDADFWGDEYRYRRKDGSYLDVEDSGIIVRDDSGRAIRFLGGMADVTERRRAERHLAERIKEARCLYRVLELTTDDAQPLETVFEAVVEELPKGFLHDRIAVARLFFDGVEYKSANWQPVRCSLQAKILSDDGPVGFVEVGYPCTPPEPWNGAGQFLTEEQTLLDGVAVHLGRMLDSRRMREELAQSERIRAVGELTGGVAHDFNNLLTVVLGNAEMIVDASAEHPELRAMAENVLRAAGRGAELTNRLLAFARRQTLDPQAIDIAVLLSELHRLLRRTLGEHIEIGIACADDLRPAWADRAQLENALLNLCLNARDAMASGGRLTIEARNAELDADYAETNEEVTPGSYVMLAVSDTGIGMPPEVARRAFEPFFTTKDVGKGSGLGLSMVYGFAKQSRGHVKIYSEPGQGTTIRLYLPVAEDGARDETRPEDAAVGSGSGQRILVVEDDDLVRDHVVGQVRSLGYDAVGVRHGPEALERLGREQFALLFTDLVMPGGMNGWQLAEEARRLHPDLPVLFTSGYTEHVMAHMGRIEEDFDLLSKPYRRQDLARMLRKICGQGQPEE